MNDYNEADQMDEVTIEGYMMKDGIDPDKAKELKARVVMTRPGWIEFQFENWRENRSRMARIELALIKIAMGAMVDPTGQSLSISGCSETFPLTPRQVLAGIVAMKSFLLKAEIDNQALFWLTRSQEQYPSVCGHCFAVRPEECEASCIGSMR